MKIIGTVANDWTIKHGVRKGLNDEALREWRDYLEDQLAQKLDLDSEISLGKDTSFMFRGKSDTHTIIEVEAFARKCLDAFLNKIGR